MERHPNDVRMPDDLEPASTSKLHTDTAKELTVPIEAKDAYDSSVHSTAPLHHVPPVLCSTSDSCRPLQCLQSRNVHVAVRYTILDNPPWYETIVLGFQVTGSHAFAWMAD